MSGGPISNLMIFWSRPPPSVSSADLLDTPNLETSAGIFLIDKWRWTERTWLEGQLRFDEYSDQDHDWAGRATVFRRLDTKGDHIGRFSIARAFRTPSAFLRRAKFRVARVGNDYLYEFMDNPQLHNEHTWSLEAGYSAYFQNNVSLNVNGYYQRFEGLISFTETATTVGPMTYIDFNPVHIDGADAYGIELELEKKHTRGKISLWYAYNQLQTDRSKQDFRGYYPADTKCGLRLTQRLTDSLRANANYRFNTDTATYANSFIGNTIRDEIHILDLNMSHTCMDGKGQVMVGVSDLFNKWTAGEETVLEPEPVVGRTWFVRLQVKN